MASSHGVAAEVSVLAFHKLEEDELHRALELLPTITSGAQPFMILMLGCGGI
jgi:hypothetical protein